MEISCKTCRYGQGIGCIIGWCIDNEELKFIPTIHCIDREYLHWKKNEKEFINEKEMKI